MEVIRTQFGAIQAEGSAFGTRSRFLGQKMAVEGDVEAVRNSFNTEWAKYVEKVQNRAVSVLEFLFLNFAE